MPEDKAMVFYIAKLARKTQQYDGRLGAHKDPNWQEEDAFWQDHDRKDCVTWYSIDGKKHGEMITTMFYDFVEGKGMEATFTPTLLNPGRKTLSELWDTDDYSLYDGYSGDKTKGTTVVRYAVFAWPATKKLEYAFQHINIDAAAAVLQVQKTVDPATLLEFMKRATEEMQKKSEAPRRRYNVDDKEPDLLSFCVMMVELIVKTEDASLVVYLFDNFFSGVKAKEKFTGELCTLLKAFKWLDVADTVLEVLNLTPSSLTRGLRWRADEEIKLALRVIDTLGCGEACEALVNGVVDKATRIDPDKLVGCGSRKLLWKGAVRSDDISVLEKLVNHFKKVKPDDLSRLIDTVLEFTDTLDTQDKRFIAIAYLAELRMKWLNQELAKLDKPFTWEMPEAMFVDNARVQAFLRGPESTMTTRNLVYFRDLKHAQRWTGHSEVKASFDLEAEGIGRDAFVTITKTRRLYESQQKLVAKLKSEKEELLQMRFKDPTGKNSLSSVGKKRPREEDEDAVMK